MHENRGVSSNDRGKPLEQPAWQLVYVSSATRRIASTDLFEIEQVSQYKNARARITGVLLFHKKTFMQFLEGASPADVHTLQRIIRRDSRHHKLEVIRNSLIPRRQFEGWSMKLIERQDLQPGSGIVERKLKTVADATQLVAANARESLFIMRSMWA